MAEMDNVQREYTAAELEQTYAPERANAAHEQTLREFRELVERNSGVTLAELLRMLEPNAPKYDQGIGIGV